MPDQRSWIAKKRRALFWIIENNNIDQRQNSVLSLCYNDKPLRKDTANDFDRSCFAHATSFILLDDTVYNGELETDQCVISGIEKSTDTRNGGPSIGQSVGAIDYSNCISTTFIR